MKPGRPLEGCLGDVHYSQRLSVWTGEGTTALIKWRPGAAVGEIHAHPRRAPTWTQEDEEEKKVLMLGSDWLGESLGEEFGGNFSPWRDGGIR